MRRSAQMLLLLAMMAGAEAVAACSSDDSQGSFPPSALTTIASDDGKLHVEVRTAPDQPPTAGLDRVELTITDPDTGAPIDGLTVAMTPWMPAMGHGASVPPLLQPMGEGRYVFTNVSLFMPGEWQLRTKFSGQVEDSVAPIFSVP